MRFTDRRDAGAQLASALARFRGQRPLVLAIPRGAVTMGQVIASTLGGDFDVVLVRKLGAPANPELAVGAVDESGWAHVAEFAEAMGATRAYLAEETARQLAILRRRRALYTPAREAVDPRGRVAIVVDDGLATGATMIAALHAVRAQRPARLVCAVPVAAPDGVAQVRTHADEFICLHTPEGFHSVAAYYRDFPQVTDEAVVEALRQAPRAHPHGEAA